MESIRVKNLRSLVDTGFIEIKPLTILVGKNNSGKSSFLRLFPLFKQSIESRTIGPILWSGDYVDFGDFNTSKYIGSKDKNISFSFKVRQDKDEHENYLNYKYQNKNLFSLKDPISYEITIQDYKEISSAIRKVFITIEDNEILFQFDESGKVRKITVNGSDFKKYISNFEIYIDQILPIIRIKKGKSIGDYKKNLMPSPYSVVYKEINSQFGIETSTDNFNDLFIEKIRVGNFELTIETLRELLNEISDFSTDELEKGIQEIAKIIILFSIPGLLETTNRKITMCFSNIQYMGPVRATAERYYRIRNLAISEVDFEGKNIAMYLRNLSDSERNDFKEWSMRLFGFYPDAHSSEGHVSLRIIEDEPGIGFNMTDMGFGFSQIMPIITSLWGIRKQKRKIKNQYPFSNYNPPLFFAIEQPELHLHPAFQARLANSFVDILEQMKGEGIDLRFIIETHSEAIISQFGKMINMGKYSSKDVNIVLFEKDEKSLRTDIRIANFNKEGYLENWPYGFFEY